jgi:hypothetical protein
LYRAAQGGQFLLFDGLVRERPSGDPGRVLGEEHSAKSDDNLSMFLLGELGLAGKQIVKNANGEKVSLSFRYLAPYLFIEEDEIIGERSPILSGQHTETTVEKNVFKALLTGQDDSAVVPVPSGKVLQTLNKGKMEILDEMIAAIDEELGDDVNRADVTDQSGRLDQSLASLQATLRQRQDELGRTVVARRDVINRRDDLMARVAELELTLERFGHLDEVYTSDIARLEALEEGGFLLKTIAGRPCAICGGDPGHQKHHHGVAEIERAHRAAVAEMRKIERERLDLRQTVVSLQAEADGLQRRTDALEQEAQDLEREIARLRPASRPSVRNTKGCSRHETMSARSLSYSIAVTASLSGRPSWSRGRRDGPKSSTWRSASTGPPPTRSR